MKEKTYQVGLRIHLKTLARIDRYVHAKACLQSIKERPYTRAKALRDLYSSGMDAILEVEHIALDCDNSIQVKINLTHAQLTSIKSVMKRKAWTLSAVVRSSICHGLKNAKVDF